MSGGQSFVWTFGGFPWSESLADAVHHSIQAGHSPRIRSWGMVQMSRRKKRMSSKLRKPRVGAQLVKVQGTRLRRVRLTASHHQPGAPGTRLEVKTWALHAGEWRVGMEIYAGGRVSTGWQVGQAGQGRAWLHPALKLSSIQAGR